MPLAASVVEVATAAAQAPTKEREWNTTDSAGEYHAVLDKSITRPVPNPDVVTASPPRENEVDDNANASSSPAAPSTATTACSYVRAAVVFVGFGSGAHSLLHLAAGPLLPLSPECTTANTSNSRREGTHGSTSTRDVLHACESGRLALALDRRGLRISGLVLVNGFISLDEQSEQVRSYSGSRKVEQLYLTKRRPSS